MITDNEIEKALEEIDKEKLLNFLIDSNELLELLHAIIEQDESLISDCVVTMRCLSEARKYIMATDLALEKKRNNMLYAEMKDSLD